MKFNKEDLLDDVHETIYERMVDQSRWHTLYERVFKHEDRYYVTRFRRGSTEYQECQPYEDDPDEIECEEVFPVEVKVTKYMTEKQLKKHNDQISDIRS